MQARQYKVCVHRVSSSAVYGFGNSPEKDVIQKLRLLCADPELPHLRQKQALEKIHLAQHCVATPAASFRSRLGAAGMFLPVRLLCGIPTINDQLSAGHKLRFLRGKVNNAVGNIVRLADMADRMHFVERLAALFDTSMLSQVVLHHRCPDVARMDRVYPDAEPRLCAIECYGLGVEPTPPFEA